MTAALQIAFDSTLLALFLSAALMLVQTLVFRRSEDLLARVDRWVVDHVLPRVGTDNPLAERLIEAIGPQLDEMGNKLARVLEPAIQVAARADREARREPAGADRPVRPRDGASSRRRWRRSSRGPTRSAGSAPISRRSARHRPRTDTLPPLRDPAADHGDASSKRRRDDVEEKHERIREFLDATGHDAVVLGLADSVAWFTSGGDLGQSLGSDQSSILLFINRTSRAVIADNVQSSRVFEEELAGLGFQLKERPWYDDPYQVVAELCHNKRVATDLGWNGCSHVRRESDALRGLRRRLTVLERQRLRELGRTLSLAVEATCRNFDPGEREADVAGHLAHRLIREGVVPVDLRVASDDRLARFRQPTFKALPDPQASDDRRHRPAARPVCVGHPHGLVRTGRRRVPQASGSGHHGRRHLHLLLPPRRSHLRGLSPSPSGSTRSSAIPTNGRSTTRAA